MKYPYSIVYAFGDRPGRGNPAGVVTDARGLSEADMQAIARLNNLSETAFLFPQEDPGTPYRIRFFTPMHPIPMCGHASIASAFLYWREKGQPERIAFSQATDVGPLRLEVGQAPGSPQIWLEMDRPLLTDSLDGERERLAEALRIPPEEIAEGLPVMVNERAYLFLPIRSLKTVQLMRPDFARMSSLDQELGLHGWYVFSRETLDPSHQVHGRFFAPYFGVPEDPVTGTANGYLASYWHRYLDGLPEDSFRVEQGFEIGCDGLLEVRYRAKSGELQEVWVGGGASLYLEGALHW